MVSKNNEIVNLIAAANREDDSAGGGWGEECRAVRANTNRGQPRRLLGQSRAKQNIRFLLEEKIRRTHIRKSEECFAWRRALGSGGGAASFVGGFPKMRSDFVQGVEPNRMIRVLRLGASPLGGQIGKNFPRLFGFKVNRLRAQNMVRANSFSSAEGGKQSDNF